MMLSQSILRNEAAQYQMLREHLKLGYADLDDETLADTLEGISDFPLLIEEIIRSSLEDDVLIQALKARAEQIAARLSRLRERHQKKRELACWALGAAGLGKLKAPDFTVSVSEGALKLEVQDESMVPAIYFVPQPARLDRGAITQALKSGEKIDGARLIQGHPYITVSTR